MGDVRLLETFLELVRIDSPPGFEAATAAYCAAALLEAGCTVRFDDSATVTGSVVGNLIAELPGTAPGILGLSAHLDVVEPCRGIEPVITGGIVHSSGHTVLGADDRSGLAAIIEVVRRFAENGEAHPTLRVLFTVQEEVGLVGAKSLAVADTRCDLCLVLDACGVPGGIVVAAPTHYTFGATFRGRAAHAGVAPEQGLSAISMAARAVSRMRLGRLDDETTANIGSIRGGTATNVIPAACDLTGECRSLDNARCEQVRAEMDAALHAAADDAGGTVDVLWHFEYQGFRYPEDQPAVLLVAEACRDWGVEPRTYQTGGGSDANVFAASGLTALALACGMEGLHGTHEQIAVADLEALTGIVEAVARRMAKGTDR